MSDRGETSRIWSTRLGAWLFNYLSHRRADVSSRNQYREIAEDLVSRIQEGRLLDIGTGPGLLLSEIYNIEPRIKLWGLDLSNAMIRRARKNLEEIQDLELITGSIESTDFEGNSFDLITCTSSFYLWNHPIECLEEIYRILRPGSEAIFFEHHSDYDIEEFNKAIEDFLKKERFFRRKLAPWFNRRALEKMYTIEEIKDIIRQSRFTNNFTIDKISISKLPIWLRITLKKD